MSGEILFTLNEQLRAVLPLPGYSGLTKNVPFLSVVPPHESVTKERQRGMYCHGLALITVQRLAPVNAFFLA